MDDIVYWTVSTGYTSELYMQKLGDLAAVQLTYDDAYVSSFTLTRDSSGKVVVEYISTEVDEFNSSSPYGKSYAKTSADDRKSTRLNSSHSGESRMPSSA